MERLTAADSWFLYLETPTVHLHVTGLMVLDPATAPGGITFPDLVTHIEQRVHLLPAFRRRLIEVPFGVDHPVWIEDPDFSLEDHVRHHVLEKHRGGELEQFVSEFCSEQLSRSRPLWEMVYVEGLEGGRTAFLTKLHHALVDGVTGMEMMATLLDTEPEVPDVVPEAVAWEPDPVPSGSRSLIDASANRLRDPMRPLRAVWRTTTATTRMAAHGVSTRFGPGDRGAGPFNSPRTAFNSTLTERRSVAFGPTSLSDVKAVRRAFGVTVNDVVLAACTSGLRRSLERSGDLPDRPLTCSVPVSVHGQGSDSANQVSTMFVHLPVHLEDPIDQLESIHASASGAKAVQSAMGPEMIGDVVDLIPPSLFQSGAGFWSRAGLPDRLPPVHNLIVSNVRGSPIPLYVAGAQVVALYPFGPLMEGTALNITVLSNLDDLDVGLISCPDLVSDLDQMLDDVLRAFETLRDLARNRPVATGAPGAASSDRDAGHRPDRKDRT